MSQNHKLEFELFEIHYPTLARSIVEWWDAAPMSIFVKLSDGSVVEYNILDNRLRNINTDESARWSSAGFGNNLLKFIKITGITQMELANDIGTSQNMISKYIRGHSIPSSEKLFMIARVLNRKMEEFFDGYYLK